MATQSQIESNRANAARSTGPRTEAGKAASSRNAIKHGLAGGVLFIEGEDPAVFQLLLDDLIAEHAPATTDESMIIENLARQFWFRRRAARLEAAALDADDLSRFALMMRYRITAERAFSKALEDLRKAHQSRPIGFVSKSTPPQPEIGFVSRRRPSRPANSSHMNANLPSRAREQAVDTNPSSSNPPQPPIGFVSQRRYQKIGRNELCPCGSGKKYKRCCLGKPESLAKAA
jgi:hypothetical protein